MKKIISILSLILVFSIFSIFVEASICCCVDSSGFCLSGTSCPSSFYSCDPCTYCDGTSYCCLIAKGKAALEVHALRDGKDIAATVKVEKLGCTGADPTTDLGTYTTPFTLTAEAPAEPDPVCGVASFYLTATWKGYTQTSGAGLLRGQKLTVNFDFSKEGRLYLEVWLSEGLDATVSGWKYYDGRYYYDPGTQAIVTAKPRTGYIFEQWFLTDRKDPLRRMYTENKSINITMDTNWVLTGYVKSAGTTTSTTSTTTTLPKGKHKLSLKGGYNLVGTNAKTILSDFSQCKLKYITIEGKGSADTPFEGWAQGSKDKSGLYLTDKLEPYQGYLMWVDEDCEVTPSGEVQEIAHLTIKEGYNLIASPAKLTVKDFADAGCELNYITIEGKGSPDTPFETWAQGSKRKDLRLVSEMEPYIGYLLYENKGCSIPLEGKSGF